MIIRTPDRDRYVTISKVPLEDERLSWKAKGLHAYLISKPDGWKVIVSHLVTQGPDGRASVMAALKELEDAGYVVRTKREKVKGRYDGMDCDVLEEPREMPGHTVSDNRQLHRVRFSAADNRTVVNKEEVNNDLVNKEANLAISAPVDLAAVRARNDAIFNRRRAK